MAVTTNYDEYVTLLKEIHRLRIAQARLPDRIAGLEILRARMERELELDGRKRKSPNGSRERQVMALLPGTVSEIRALTDMSENQIRICLKRMEEKNWVRHIGRNPALWIKQDRDGRFAHYQKGSDETVT